MDTCFVHMKTTMLKVPETLCALDDLQNNSSLSPLPLTMVVGVLMCLNTLAFVQQRINDN